MQDFKRIVVKGITGLLMAGYSGGVSALSEAHQVITPTTQPIAEMTPFIVTWSARVAFMIAIATLVSILLKISQQVKGFIDKEKDVDDG